jgi:protein-S-isoprenylcysteine O-methyltransferase Ste14
VLVKAVVAFLVLPGTVAYAVPLLLAPWEREQRPWQLLGPMLVLAGTILLLFCVREFYLAGKGTLAPWAPPQDLVVSGLFRWSRNPMYVSVIVVLLGWSIWFASPLLFAYAAAVSIAFHLRVLLYEEPRLAETFGEAWCDYRDRVPRWLAPNRRSAAGPRPGSESHSLR